jgi:alpha-tubulin suppressor-like RCC1 family protein
MSKQYQGFNRVRGAVGSLAFVAVLLPVVAGCDAAVDTTDGDEIGLRGLAMDPGSIAAGANHTCALDRTAGTVWCWGSNSTDDVAQTINGKLGHGVAVTHSAVPVQVVHADDQPLTDVIQVSAGGEHTCAVRGDRSVWCWGSDVSGQIGNGSSDNNIPKIHPIQVPGLADVKQVSAGGMHTCAVRHDGTAMCWGRDLHGELGDVNHAGSVSVPVQVAGMNGAGVLTGVSSISAGTLHTCAVVGKGFARCWGGNSHGMLGRGVAGGLSETPVPVVTGPDIHTPALAGVTRIDAGTHHSCALATDGAVWCWGSNAKGALGNGESSGIRPYAVQVRDAATGQAIVGATSVTAGSNFTKYSNAAAHSCVTKPRGVLQKGQYAYCWGDNQWNSTRLARLGTNGTNSTRAVPVLAGDGGEFGAVVAIEAGAFHTCAVDVFAKVWCWANNEKGQIGDGSADLDDHTRPTPVVGLPDLTLLWEEEDELWEEEDELWEEEDE